MEKEFVDGEIGDDLPEMAILALEFLQTFRLGGGHPAELLSPKVIGDIRDAQDFDCLGDPLALPQQHASMSELPGDLFRGEALLRHDLSPPEKVMHNTETQKLGSLWVICACVTYSLDQDCPEVVGRIRRVGTTGDRGGSSISKGDRAGPRGQGLLADRRDIIQLDEADGGEAGVRV